MHGILRLRKMIQDDPDMSWRSRYHAEGTEEKIPGAEPAVPDQVGLELIAAPARGDDPRQRRRRRRSSATGPPLEIAPGAASATCSARCASAHGFRCADERSRGRLLPRRAAPRRALRAARHGAPSTASRSSCASRSPSRWCESVTPDWPTANHQEREVYDMFGVRFAGSSRPAAHPDARGLRGPPAAARLPDRRRAGALHPQRRDQPGMDAMSSRSSTTASSRSRSRCRRSSSRSPRSGAARRPSS